jgi:biotin transport system substrate-specific component
MDVTAPPLDLTVARRPSPAVLVARELALLAAASLFLALTARITVPLPFTPVPVTGQTLGVLLVGALYGPRRGALAVVAYLLEGIAGLPVFSAGRSGLPFLLGPTGGYLIGFVPAAAVAGMLGHGARPAWLRLAGLLLASVVVYVFGAPWLAIVAGRDLAGAISVGVLPFLPGDVLKAGLAAGVVPAGAGLLSHLGIRPR